MGLKYQQYIQQTLFTQLLLNFLCKHCAICNLAGLLRTLIVTMWKSALTN